MEDSRIWPLTARKPIYRFRQNLKQMIKSATRPLMPYLVIVSLAGARPRIGKIVTPGVYFFTFFTF